MDALVHQVIHNILEHRLGCIEAQTFAFKAIDCVQMLNNSFNKQAMAKRTYCDI